MVRNTAGPLSVHLSICHSIIFICLSVFSYLSSSFITSAYLSVLYYLCSSFCSSVYLSFIFSIPVQANLSFSLSEIVCLLLYLNLRISQFAIHIFYSCLSMSFSLSLSFYFTISLCPPVTMFQVLQFLYFPLCFSLLCLLSTVKSENG
jgi:hypothetical protein